MYGTTVNCLWTNTSKTTSPGLSSLVNNFLCAYLSPVRRISHFTGQSSSGMLHEQGSGAGRDLEKIQRQIR